MNEPSPKFQNHRRWPPPEGYERSMRPIKLSSKNSLFAGSDEGADNWAAAASLIETCKLNRVNPQTYFTDLLTRLVNGWPEAQLDELMPWCWKPSAAN